MLASINVDPLVSHFSLQMAWKTFVEDILPDCTDHNAYAIRQLSVHHPISSSLCDEARSTRKRTTNLV